MTTKRKGPSRLTTELLEMTSDMHRVGVMDDATYEKIVMRHDTGRAEGLALAPLAADDIKALREQAHMSQAVFAKCLNLTTGYISQLERGAKRPTGPALVLLHVIRQHGIQTILQAVPGR